MSTRPRTGKGKKSSGPPAHLVAARAEDKFQTRVEEYGPHELLRLLNAGESYKRRVSLDELADRLEQGEVSRQELVDLRAPEACFKLLAQHCYPTVREASIRLLCELAKGSPSHALRLVQAGLIPLVLPLLQADSVDLRRLAKRLLMVLSPEVTASCSALHPLMQLGSRKKNVMSTEFDLEVQQLMHAYGDGLSPSDSCVSCVSTLICRYVGQVLAQAKRASPRRDSGTLLASQIARAAPEYAANFMSIKQQGGEQWAAMEALSTREPRDKKLVERVLFAKQRLEKCDESERVHLLQCLNVSLVTNKRDRFRRYFGVKGLAGRALELLGHVAQQRAVAMVTEAVRAQCSGERYSAQVPLVPLEPPGQLLLDELLVGAAKSVPKMTPTGALSGVDWSWFDDDKKKRPSEEGAGGSSKRAKKSTAGGKKEPEFCVCRSSSDFGFMIGCDECSEWFHGKCVGLTKRHETGDTWKCPFCTGAVPRPE